MKPRHSFIIIVAAIALSGHVMAQDKTDPKKENKENKSEQKKENKWSGCEAEGDSYDPSLQCQPTKIQMLYTVKADSVKKPNNAVILASKNDKKTNNVSLGAGGGNVGGGSKGGGNVGGGGINNRQWGNWISALPALESAEEEARVVVNTSKQSAIELYETGLLNAREILASKNEKDATYRKINALIRVTQAIDEAVDVSHEQRVTFKFKMYERAYHEIKKQLESKEAYANSPFYFPSPINDKNSLQARQADIEVLAFVGSFLEWFLNTATDKNKVTGEYYPVIGASFFVNYAMPVLKNIQEELPKNGYVPVMTRVMQDIDLNLVRLQTFWHKCSLSDGECQKNYVNMVVQSLFKVKNRIQEIVETIKKETLLNPPVDNKPSDNKPKK